MGPSGLSSPAVDSNIVYLYTEEQYNYAVIALRADDGTQLWNRPIGKGSGVCASTPIVVNGFVYVGTPDHKVYALNAKNGKILWTYTTQDEINSSPAVVNGTVYVGSNDHDIYAINATTGKKIWSYTTDGEVQTPVIRLFAKLK